MGVYIDIALSLVFVYLVLSLVVSAVNELISMWIRKRPAMLAKSILSLIDDPGLWRSFYDSGVLVNPRLASQGAAQSRWTSSEEASPGPGADAPAFGRGLDWKWKWYLFPTRSTTEGHPSFIDGTTFARALTMGVLKQAAGGKLPGSYVLDDVRKAVGKLDPVSGRGSQIREVLISALSNAEGELRLFEKEVGAWYDRAQDRLTGEYTRWAKIVTLIIGAALVCLINVDTVRIARELRLDTDTREKLVASALDAARPGSDSPVSENCEPLTAVPAATPDEQRIEAEKCQLLRAQRLIATLGPDLIGWQNDDLRRTALRWPLPAEVVGHAFNKLLGLLITICAISLGAPFWFDMLSKVVNIRAAGLKPESSSGAKP
ncbi:hypothetical protein [Amaricoccus solimangrovi]|uniref:Uncharacterized protein n=1 Tax=Amaricoccus solimangrovi TaxID=2589815 RepID=A0A501WW38_9RHOB|nr:hypothetical protein [Amaricoccus solimangrovi]TPE53648.1 hypothetical protein FJM51_00940 [Amaricoccus solimangrovi]